MPTLRGRAENPLKVDSQRDFSLGDEHGPVDVLLADRYALGEPLGWGGLGEVVAARDLELRRRVAVKVLHPHLAQDRIALACFAAGTQAAAALTHPDIVAVYDAGWTSDGRPFAVMELVEGHSLAAEVAERGPVPEARVADIGRCMARALCAAHRRGVLHGDVKPGNVLLAADGRVLLTDFGAVDLPGRPDGGRDVLGTAGYIAPELLRGEPASPATDVFGLGATLLHAVRGGGGGAGPSDLRLAAALGRAVSDDPSERWPSALSLEAELGAIVPDAATAVFPVPRATRPGLGSASSPVTRWQPPRSKPNRAARHTRPERLLAVTALVLAALAVLPALLFAGRTSAGPDSSENGRRRGTPSTATHSGGQSRPGSENGSVHGTIRRQAAPIAPKASPSTLPIPGAPATPGADPVAPVPPVPPVPHAHLPPGAPRGKYVPYPRAAPAAPDGYPVAPATPGY